MSKENTKAKIKLIVQGTSSILVIYADTPKTFGALKVYVSLRAVEYEVMATSIKTPTEDSDWEVPEHTVKEVIRVKYVNFPTHDAPAKEIEHYFTRLEELVWNVCRYENLIYNSIVLTPHEVGLVCREIQLAAMEDRKAEFPISSWVLDRL